MFVYVAEVSDVDFTGLDCFVDGAAVVTESFAVDVAAVRGEGLFAGGPPGAAVRAGWDRLVLDGHCCRRSEAAVPWG